MEEALQRLELLIQHTGANREVATKAFLDACKLYAVAQGFNLDVDCMAIHKALIPSKVEFNGEAEHIIVHESAQLPYNSIVFFRENTFFQ
jgi:hypothetical protein